MTDDDRKGFFLDDSTGSIHVDVTRQRSQDSVAIGDYAMVVGPLREHADYGREVTGFQTILLDKSNALQEEIWTAEILHYWNCLHARCVS